jgi:hypothetical protein
MQFGTLRVEGVAQDERARVLKEPPGLPRHDSSAVYAERGLDHAHPPGVSGGEIGAVAARKPVVLQVRLHNRYYRA